VFTYDGMVNNYCARYAGFEDRYVDPMEDSEENEGFPKARMNETKIQFQAAADAEVDDCPILAINALHQVHSPKHRPMCFKCQKMGKEKKRKHTCGKTCECRYRIPDRARPQTVVQEVESALKWYTWNGKTKDQPIVKFCPKRLK